MAKRPFPLELEDRCGLLAPSGRFPLSFHARRPRGNRYIFHGEPRSSPPGRQVDGGLRRRKSSLFFLSLLRVPPFLDV